MTDAKPKYPKMSEARLRMLNSQGRLYAAYSRYCDWIKLGFTLDLYGRLEKINRQYDDFAPFSLIGFADSTWRAEQQIHRILEPFRQHNTGRSKELYPATPSLVRLVKMMFDGTPWLPLDWDLYRELRESVYQAAKSPLDRVEARLAFERYRAERRGAA